MSASITITKFEDFDLCFGDLGAKVGPRIGPNKRTQDQKEWYVVRRFLKEAISARKFQLPARVERGHPPDPDFLVVGNLMRALIEITEATSEADQREMTLQEYTNEPILLGDLGGRFRGGGGEPGHLWASDVVEAIERKKEKSIFSTKNVERHLVIYPNSNASFLIFNDEDERRAFALLANLIDDKREELSRIVGECSVHILGKKYIFFNVAAKAVRRRRRFTTVG